MTLRIFADLEQRSDEWHDLRRGMVTASAVRDLVTPSTLKPASNDTSRALTRLLVAERITGHTDPTFVNADMQRGIEHEPIARDVYSGHYQQAVECGFMVREEDGWTLGLSPDGLVGDEGGIEIKCPRAKEHVRTLIADKVPSLYVPQIQAALLVSGRAWWDFVSFHGGLPLYVKRVLPDPDWHAAIEAACRAFEVNAAQMVADYTAAITGLPMTERVPDYGDII